MWPTTSPFSSTSSEHHVAGGAAARPRSASSACPKAAATISRMAAWSAGRAWLADHPARLGRFHFRGRQISVSNSAGGVLLGLFRLTSNSRASAGSFAAGRQPGEQGVVGAGQLGVGALVQGDGVYRRGCRGSRLHRSRRWPGRRSGRRGRAGRGAGRRGDRPRVDATLTSNRACRGDPGGEALEAAADLGVGPGVLDGGDAGAGGPGPRWSRHGLLETWGAARFRRCDLRKASGGWP